VAQPLHRLTDHAEFAAITLAKADAEAWAKLGEGVMEPAAGAMPAWLEPQMRLAVSSSPPSGIWQNGKLLGVAALERQNARWLPGWPVDVSFETPLFFSGIPLIARDGAEEALAALIAGRNAPLLLKSLPVNGPFWDGLGIAARRLNAPVEIVESWERAALRLDGDFESWFEKNFERKRRKEYRRWRSRLAEMGKLESRSWRPGEALEPWFEDFCALEATGWKGKRGSAIACDSELKACLREALDNLAGTGQLRFWSIALDGKVIATMFAQVVGEKAWLGKIAFDESHAKYSPGVLQILDATEALFEDGSIDIVDSCAIPNHPMIDNIWRDRIVVADVLIGTPNMPQSRFKAMVAAENFRRRTRSAAKDVYNRFIRRQKP